MLFPVLYIWQIWQDNIQSFPLLLDPPGNLDLQAIQYPRATFGQLSRGSVTNSMLITVFDTYLTPKVTRSLSLSKDPSDSEYSALTYFSMSLAHKYVNLKEPYNQDIKEQVTTKNFFKKKTFHSLHEISTPEA